MVRIPKIVLGVLLAVLILSCGNSESEKEPDHDLWVGNWIMTGYDTTSVENRDTLLLMKIKKNSDFSYITQTRGGEVIYELNGTYKLNDQKSIFMVYENNKKVMEYVIRKVDQDSLIFQSDSFQIQWKRIE